MKKRSASKWETVPRFCRMRGSYLSTIVETVATPYSHPSFSGKILCNPRTTNLQNSTSMAQIYKLKMPKISEKTHGIYFNSLYLSITFGIIICSSIH